MPNFLFSNQGIRRIFHTSHKRASSSHTAVVCNINQPNRRSGAFFWELPPAKLGFPNRSPVPFTTHTRSQAAQAHCVERAVLERTLLKVQRANRYTILYGHHRASTRQGPVQNLSHVYLYSYRRCV